MSLISKYNDNFNIVGNNIRKYRIQNNLSYEQLSAKLDLLGVYIHKQSIYDIENNKRTVKDYELFAISKVLNVPINQLFNGIKM